MRWPWSKDKPVDELLPLETQRLWCGCWAIIPPEIWAMNHGSVLIERSDGTLVRRRTCDIHNKYIEIEMTKVGT